MRKYGSEYQPALKHTSFSFYSAKKIMYVQLSIYPSKLNLLRKKRSSLYSNGILYYEILESGQIVILQIIN